jgi:hypothetical protein
MVWEVGGSWRLLVREAPLFAFQAMGLARQTAKTELVMLV